MKVTDLLTPFRASTLLETYESFSDDISSNTAFHTDYQVCQKGVLLVFLRDADQICNVFFFFLLLQRAF